MFNKSNYKVQEKTLKLLENADEIMAMYQSDIPLEEISNKFNTNSPMINKIRVFKGIKRRSTIKRRRSCRQQLTMKKIKFPEHLKRVLGSGTLYKLQALYSDYLFESVDGKTIILIEEKKSLSKYTLMSAITQLELGEKLLKEEKNINISGKILYVKTIRPSPPSNPNDSFIRYIMVDIEKYLNIKIVIER